MKYIVFLQIVFVALKISGAVDWCWICVFIPLLLVVVFLFALCCLLVLVEAFGLDHKPKKDTSEPIDRSLYESSN